MDKWKIKCHQKQLSWTLQEKVIRYTDKDFYPNIHALLVIITTLPVTSCECERSISLLRHLKTALQSTMGEDRLNN